MRWSFEENCVEQPSKHINNAEQTYPGLQLGLLQICCDVGFKAFEHELNDAGVSSSDRTQLTSRVDTPVKKIISKILLLV